jgi:hypothetical protein
MEDAEICFNVFFIDYSCSYLVAVMGKESQRETEK